MAALWMCPDCGQSFVGRNMAHSCTVLTADEFFGTRQHQRELYEQWRRFVERRGPITVNVNKTRISFQARVRFAGVTRVRRDGLVCNFWLKHRIDSPRFSKVELIPPSNWVYSFLLTSERQLDDEVREWIELAYRVGRQEPPP